MERRLARVFALPFIHTKVTRVDVPGILLANRYYCCVLPAMFLSVVLQQASFGNIVRLHMRSVVCTGRWHNA